jgi:hypothetical protein
MLPDIKPCNPKHGNVTTTNIHYAIARSSPGITGKDMFELHSGRIDDVNSWLAANAVTGVVLERLQCLMRVRNVG